MGSIKTQIDNLLQQEMGRRDFLKYSGSVLLAIIGITGLLRIFLNVGGTVSEPQPTNSRSGYGASRYGR